MNMHYCFHPDESPRCVDTAEYERLLGDGWYDSPGKFPVKDAGLAAKTSDVVDKKDVEENTDTEISDDGKPRRGRPKKIEFLVP